MRRSVRTIVCVALGALVAITFTVTTSAARAGTSPADWSQTDSNAAASRANLGETTLTPHSIGHVRYLRSVLAAPIPINSDGCELGGVTQPVLTGGRLYAMVGGYLTAYNAATGAVIWRVNPDKYFTTNFISLVVTGATVLVSGNDCISQSDPGGYVAAYSTVNGAPKWTRGFESAVTAMVVSGNYLAETGSTLGSGEATSVLRVSNGSQVWLESGGNECANDGGAVVEAGLMVHDHCDNNGRSSIEADRLATGAKVWSRPGEWHVVRGDSDTSAGRHLYATHRGTVYDLNPATGAIQHTLSGAIDVLAVDATQAYATCSSDQLCAYNGATGAKVWTTYEGSTFAAEAGGLLYMQSGYVLKTSTGDEVTLLDNTYPDVASAVVVGDGRVAMVSEPRVLDLFGLAGS